MAVKKTSVYLNDDEVVGLRNLAATSGRSQADLIRHAVRRLIDDAPARSFRSMGMGRGDGQPLRRWDQGALYDEVMGDPGSAEPSGHDPDR